MLRDRKLCDTTDMKRSMHPWGWGHFRGEGISRVNNVAEKQGSFQDSPLGAIKPPPPGEV